jgi:Na+/H+ antiporter NhaC
MGLYTHHFVSPTWVEQKTTSQVTTNELGQLSYRQGQQEIVIEEVVPYAESPLRQSALDELDTAPTMGHQWVVETDTAGTQVYSMLQPTRHFGPWSLLPAFAAICLCLMTKEPITSLFGGIVVGAFMLGRFDITDGVLIPSFATTSGAGILLLYLWLLGGLLGVWSRTGAAQAFAGFAARKFVRGPRSAKLVAWFLGIVFFQGGTVSIVLTGVATKPLADSNKVSHEETSFIIDATGAPVASLLAFNAWPLFVQALIFIPGVAVLSTESSRLGFYFTSQVFSFYTILIVLGALLLSIDFTGFPGKGLQRARERSRETGQLDAPGSNPTSAVELHASNVPAGYSPNVLEFVAPLILLITIAVGSFVAFGSPQVNWAFGAALLLSASIAMLKGMSLSDVINGIGDGLKGVVVAVIILLLAITVGGISAESGGGLYLIELLGDGVPYFVLPTALFVLTMATAFSTGTSWGTYAIAYPLAMPLAWAIAQSQGLANPELYLSICFASILNGGVFGDQCSPISDTTILSATTTGGDLMDHVNTQLVPSIFIACISAVLWTITAVAIA